MASIDLERVIAGLKRPFQKGDRRRGMTLIEIIIVVALLAGLMAILVRNVTASADAAKRDQSKIAMASIAQSLQMYYIRANKYPTTQQGLDALVNDPGGNTKWQGPYIEKDRLNDPWGTLFDYTSDGRTFQIVSAGADEQLGTDDDVFYPEKSKDKAEGAPAQ